MPLALGRNAPILLSGHGDRCERRAPQLGFVGRDGKCKIGGASQKLPDLLDSLEP